MEWISGRHVIVTGATSGIGREVATQLAARGARLVLGCRDTIRGAEAAAEIAGATGGPEPGVLQLDTSDPASIRAFARTYSNRYGAAHVLVNNAGVLLPERLTTGSGIEVTFATNVLGYHLVTAELLGALEEGAPARVVNVASSFAFGVDLDDLQFERREYDGMTAYAQSKALDRMLTWALARRLDPARVTANAMAPGLVMDTSLYRHLQASAKRELAGCGTRPVAEACEGAVRLAADEDLAGVTGIFVDEGSERPCEFRDDAREEHLWNACADLASRQVVPR